MTLAFSTVSPGTEPSALSESGDWHRSLAEAIREPRELLSRLQLDESLLPAAQRSAELFPLLVPLSYLKRMRPGDANDPLLRQVLPLGAESDSLDGFVHDAVEEARFRSAPGLIQKYDGRTLLIATGSCAVHCRYCFRRHYPYGEEPRRLDDWDPALQVLAEDSSLSEVILSGGDPLMLTDHRLLALLDRIEGISHLRRLRLHTRLPIVLPDRVTAALLERLESSRLTSVVVVHANHGAEIAGDCKTALQMLGRSGVTTLNQTVLLRGVNDSIEALAELSERLIDAGVVPYYLHQLDRVAGTAHFEVPVETGRRLIKELRERLPGYAVPRYVQEIPGEPHKTILT